MLYNAWHIAANDSYNDTSYYYTYTKYTQISLLSNYSLSSKFTYPNIYQHMYIKRTYK